MIKLFMYTQKVTDARDSSNVKTWDKVKVSYNKHTFDAVLTKEVRGQLDYLMKQKGVKMPIIIELDDNDYFTKKRSYTTKDGRKGTKTVIVIGGFVDFEQAQFEVHTLDDIVAELDKEE